MPMGIVGSTPALFLDRDGVINVDHGYVHRVEQFEFMPGIFELVRFAARELRWPVVVASNQSGIGRGYFDEIAYRALTDWMCARFDAAGAALTRVYHCPYHAEHGLGSYRVEHPWRKPKPGMFLQAAVDLDLDLARSAAIGDQMRDVEAAAAAGVGLVIRLAQTAGGETIELPHVVVPTLAAALAVLRQHVAWRA
jgi:D-glycero-D-manno-heptose 1,7-bisphosphate phosphatase